MRSYRAARAFCAAACFAASLLTAAGPAAGDTGTSCETAAQVAGRIPIILVHGFSDGPGAWSRQSQDTLGGAAPGTCIAVFDYADANTEWVTDPRIGTALATKIVSLAAESPTGKVILVGHSMGGLAVRCAADRSCNHGVVGVSKLIAGLVTFGTPNLGSFLRAGGASHVEDAIGLVLAAACLPNAVTRSAVCTEIRALGTSPAAKAFTPGSSLLSDLPNLPPTIPVEAVAGSVTLTDQLFFQKIPLGDAGDLVVANQSALQAANAWHGVGGRATVNCGEISVAEVGTSVQLDPSLSCWHVSEPRDAAFLEVAVRTIRELVDAAPPPGIDAAHTVTFSSVGQVRLGMTAAELTAAGYAASPESNGCVQYSTADGTVYIDLKPSSDSVVSIDTSGSTAFRTTDGISVGSSLTQVQAAYHGHTVESHLDGSFGQGADGLLVEGTGGWLAFAIDGGKVADIRVGDHTYAPPFETSC